MQTQAGILHNYKRSLLFGALIGFAIGISFVIGFLFRGLVYPIETQAADNDYSLLREVQALLDQHYLRKQPDAQQLEYGAIRGVIATLNDKYTFFVEPPVAKSESDVLAGTYGGIGIQLERSEDGKLVIYPFKGSPVLEQGISEGDILVEVNDKVVDLSIQPDTLDQMMRGEVKTGNGVKLKVLKLNGTEINVFVPFVVVNVPSVTWRLVNDGPFGYIKISLFTSRTPQELEQAFKELDLSRIKALILDLRDNSGGLLKESIDVAGQFVPGGIIVYERTNSEENSLTAPEQGLATNIPIVVLVNKGTASAAELVAGAIRDRNRGILIGQQTYGKGTVQQIFRLSDNSSLHITAAEWLTPSHQHLDGQGLEPTISMIPDVNGRDVELGEAIRYLLAMISNAK